MHTRSAQLRLPLKARGVTASVCFKGVQLDVESGQRLGKKNTLNHSFVQQRGVSVLVHAAVCSPIRKRAACACLEPGLQCQNARARGVQGTAVLNTVFKEYGPWSGDINTRELGSLVAFETGAVTGYSLESTQQRGRMFCGPGDEVYEGQVGACVLIWLCQSDCTLSVSQCCSRPPLGHSTSGARQRARAAAA